MALNFLDSLTAYGSASGFAEAGLTASGSSVSVDSSGGAEGGPCIAITGSGQLAVPLDGTHPGAPFAAMVDDISWIGFRMKVVSAPLSGETTFASVWQSTNRVASFQITPSLKIKAIDTANATYGYSIGPAVRQGVWHWVVVRTQIDGSQGSLRVFVDGEQRLVVNNADTDVDTGPLELLRLGDSGNPTLLGHTLHFDNLVAFDADGATPGSGGFTGSGLAGEALWKGVVEQLPTGTVSADGSVVGAASAHLAADDPFGADNDGDSTYFEPDALLGFPAIPSGTVETPHAVVASVEMRDVDTNIGTISVDSSGARESSILSGLLSTSYQRYKLAAEEDPDAAGDWTKSAASAARVSVATFNWPASAKFAFLWDDAAVTSSPDVDSITDILSGYVISQGTGSKKPHLESDSLSHDRAAVQVLVRAPGSVIWSAGTYPTILLVSKLNGTATNQFWAQASNPSDFGNNSMRLVAGTSFSPSWETPEGNVFPSYAFGDTADWHLHRSTLTPDGGESALDAGTASTAALTNTGVTRDCTQLSLGARVDSGGGGGDINTRIYVGLSHSAAEVADGTQAADIAAVEAYLMNEWVP